MDAEHSEIGLYLRHFHTNDARDNILNSKSEFMGEQLPRLTIETKDQG